MPAYTTQVTFPSNEKNPRTLRSLSFYTRVFGWELGAGLGTERFWPISTTIDEAEEELEDVLLPTSAIAVRSLEEAWERIEREGGRVVTPRIAVPGSGFLAYCEDSNGHPFGIFESDPSAR